MTFPKQALLLFALPLLFSTSAYADESDCNDVPGDGHIQCTYLTGLSKDVKDGRYLKVTISGKGTDTECANYSDTLTILAEDAPHFLGGNTEDWSICNDAAGSDCTAVGTATFTVTQNGTSYTASPDKYNVDLTKVNLKNYSQCDATSQPEHLHSAPSKAAK
jgi:hypothetical protein